MNESKERQLEKLTAKIASCQKCPLYKIATNPVPGEGNPNADIFFVGEAPGRHEDQQGRPFVGQAGKLLEKALALIGLNREDVFITNVLHHRPPGNRDPMPTEVNACGNYFLRQLEIIQPKIVAPLGRFALNTFLPESTISQVRGTMQKIPEKNYILFPLYHPAAALRSGRLLENFKSDFAKLGKLLALERKSLQNLSTTEEAVSKTTQTELNL
jgi:uracil-DNA glycosylase family 4